MANRSPDTPPPPWGSVPGWVAYSPRDDQIEDQPWLPPDGSTIRLMGDDSVDVPLWDDVNGLMFNDVTELVRELGVSSELASDLSV